MCCSRGFFRYLVGLIRDPGCRNLLGDFQIARQHMRQAIVGAVLSAAVSSSRFRLGRDWLRPPRRVRLPRAILFIAWAVSGIDRTPDREGPWMLLIGFIAAGSFYVLAPIPDTR